MEGNARMNADGMVPDFDWLEQKARELLNKALVIGEDGIHYWNAATTHYANGCWIKELAYYWMHGPSDAFDWREAGRTLERYFEYQGPDGTIPDKIICRKMAGDPQARKPAHFAVAGAHAEEDNAAFLVLAADRVCEALEDDSLFRVHWTVLEKALHSVSRCPASGLVVIDPLDPHSGYGYCDMVDKRGHDLFCSILWWQAACIMAKRFERIGRPDKARPWRDRALWVRMHIIPAFWDDESELLFAATRYCRQADIWGSAYAVVSGAVDGDYADCIRDALWRSCDRVVRWGQVRHTLSSCWMRMQSEHCDYRGGDGGKVLPQVPPGSYQNGAFWATATGWFAGAIAGKDADRARAVVAECIEYFKANDVYECVEVDEAAGHEGRGRCPGYVTSAVNVLFARTWGWARAE